MEPGAALRGDRGCVGHHCTRVWRRFWPCRWAAAPHRGAVRAIVAVCGAQITEVGPEAVRVDDRGTSGKQGRVWQRCFALPLLVRLEAPVLPREGQESDP